jgi:hypothetical protein
MSKVMFNLPIMKSKSPLEQAKEKLLEMLSQADALEFRIAKQRRMIGALIELSDESEDVTPSMGLVKGITDAIRTVVRSAEKPLFPVEIALRIERLGIPEQKNMLVSVHTILKRLAEAGDVRKIGEKNDRWVWITLGERLLKEEQTR